jgi:CRISPR-associated protein (TIGR02584 family)
MVSGLSPQVVTETIFALAMQTEPFIATEVHLITTREGAQRADLSLLSKDMGWFQKLRVEYDLPEIDFSQKNIHVVENSSGTQLEDIRSIDDNRLAADFITNFVRELTADANCALHVSIAGGRKTMGFYLGYALSLYGRPQDRLSHVLVSQPFENTLDFFFPTKGSHVLKTGNGALADTSTAKVTLAEIPFVSLRHGLPEGLLSGNASFNETVSAAKEALAPPTLEIDRRQKFVRAGAHLIKLPPAELALLSVFARNKLADWPPLDAPTKGVPDPIWGQKFLEEYHFILGKFSQKENPSALKDGMDGEYFSTCKSKLEKRLKKALKVAAPAYRIDGGSKRPHKYQLLLPKSAIQFLS